MSQAVLVPSPELPSSKAPTPQSVKRIDVIDALRGMALAGILLLHHIERFNFFWGADKNPQWAQQLDGFVGPFFFLLFGGKSYAVFSMLFGFSFWIMYSKRKERGEPFAGRFMWRLALLACFGVVHSLFYTGDLLLYYALFGFVVVLVRNWSDRALAIAATVLMLQPQGWWRALNLMFNSGYTLPPNLDWHYMEQVHPLVVDGAFLPWVWANITDGFMGNLQWMLHHGRMCHIPALFMVGMLACRRRVFTELASRGWVMIGAAGLAIAAPLYVVRGMLPKWTADEGLRLTLGWTIDSYVSTALAVVGVALFVLAWRAGGDRVMRVLVPYGRMSLTNYMAGSLLGAFIYYNWGLRLFPYAGATVAVLIGLACLALLIALSHWCMGRFGQGPMEKLWRRLTWVGFRRVQSAK